MPAIRFALLLLALLPSLAFASSDAMQDANALFRQGRYINALARIDAYLANHPKDAQTFPRGALSQALPGGDYDLTTIRTYPNSLSCCAQLVRQWLYWRLDGSQWRIALEQSLPTSTQLAARGR